jgi:hypothetical protein
LVGNSTMMAAHSAAAERREGGWLADIEAAEVG